MAQQTVLDKTQKSDVSSVKGKDNYSLEYFLEIASFFDNPGRREQLFDNFWSFEKIDSLLRSWAVPFNSDLKNASFEEVVGFLKKLVAENFTVEGTLITPGQIEQFEEDAQRIKKEILQTKENASEFSQKLIERLTKSPINPALQTKIAQNLSLTLQKQIEDSELPLLAEKLAGAPLQSEISTQLKEKVDQEFQKVWETSVQKTSESLRLNKDEEAYLNSLSSSGQETTRPTASLNEIEKNKRQIIDSVRKMIVPAGFSETEALKVAEETAEALVTQQTYKEPQTLVISPEKQQTETQTELDKTLKSVFNSLGIPDAQERLGKTKASSQQLEDVSFYLQRITEIRQRQARDIAQTILPFSQERAELFANQVLTPFSDYLPSSGHISPSDVEKAAIAAIWQTMGSERLKPEEISKAVNLLSQSSQEDLIRYRKFTPLPTSTLPLETKDEKGETIFEKVKRTLYQDGIGFNSQSDKELTSLKYQLQAMLLMSRGFDQKDIETQIQQLLKGGFTENSPKIQELRAVYQEYESLIQTAKQNGYSQKQLSAWIKEGPSSMNLFLSRFETIINKTGIKSSFFNNFKTRFLNSSFGKPFKLALEKSAQKGLQAFWSASREGIKKIAIKVAPKLFTALGGLGAKTIAVLGGNVLGILAIAGIKIIGKFKNSITKFFSSGLRISSSIFSGITNASDIPENEDSKWLKWIIIGVFAVLAYLIISDKNTKNISMIGENVLEIDNQISFSMTTSPLQCQNPRHLAEETICKLSQGDSPCNQNKVNKTNWSLINDCFKQIDLSGNKNNIKNAFSDSVLSLNLKSLQCVGFIKGIQAGMGKNIIKSGNAKDFLNFPYPLGYTFIDGNENDIRKNDIAIWKGNKYGHIAIVVEVKEKKINNELGKIIVAQAWGTNSTSGGFINLTESFYGKKGIAGCPDGYLRPF